MKAWTISKFGGPEVLELGDFPDPEIGPGEILVDVHAFSVNAADGKVRAGITGPKDPQWPYGLGRDFSGIVREAGGDSDLKPGDAVFAVLPRGIENAYADTVTIEAAIAARKPDELSHEDAAALALTGLTALCALEDAAKLQKGQSILIQGGSGGVGSVAVQYAHHVGADVYATARTQNQDYLRSLGADHPIDYTKAPFEEQVPKLDLVFDTVGGEIQSRSVTVLKPGGRLYFVAPSPDGVADIRKDVEVIRPPVPRDRAHLDRVVELVKAGALRAPETTVLPFTEVQEAHRQIDTHHVRGKLILKVR